MRTVSAIMLAGLLAGCVIGTGGAGVDASATPSEAATPSPLATSSPSPTPSPQASATPEVTPTPIPVGEIGEIELTARTCPGGVVLDWSTLRDPRFHHYTVLRSHQGEIDLDYPPIAPAVDWGTTFATDPFVTTAVDASLVPGPTEWNYRAIAYDVRDRPIAASPVRQARLDPVVDLGNLSARARTDGETRLRWSTYDGDARCFSWYALVASRINAAPSHNGGANTLAVISGRATDDLVTDALEPGATYFLRLQAIRTSPLGEFVVAQTAVTTYTVPLAPA